MLTRHVSFNVRRHDGYCVVRFLEEIGKAGVSDFNAASSQLMKDISQIKTPAFLVDLTALNYMGSSLVACVVRIWKSVQAQHGTMVVVVSSDGIFDVLKATGLTKIWTIVDSLEAGVHTLGFSPKAKVAKRERRLLFFVGPIALTCGCIAATLRFLPQLSWMIRPADSLVYSILGLSLLASAISSFREQAWHRIVSVVVLVFSLALVGTYFATANPSPGGSSTANLPSESTSTPSSAGQPDVVAVEEAKPDSPNGDPVVNPKSGEVRTESGGVKSSSSDAIVPVAPGPAESGI